MKKRELEKQLRKLGWRFLRHGSNHDIWWNGKINEKGEVRESIPRHREVEEDLARKILKRARAEPGE
jgi:mRNA interferase HicA